MLNIKFFYRCAPW